MAEARVRSRTKPVGGQRNYKITQDQHPFGAMGPQSAAVLLTRAANKAGLGKGMEAQVKQKYKDQDAAYAKAHARIKNQGKTAAVATPKPKKKATRVATK